MLIKKNVRLNQGLEDKICGICNAKIKPGDKYYHTRRDYEARSIKRVTCNNCANQ